MSRLSVAVVILSALIIALPVRGIAQTPLLPGGASSLQETHQDWQVICVVRETARICAVSQQQTKRDTNQRVLTVEYLQDANGSVNGSLILPFGLLLSSGITLQIDDKPVGRPLPFRTCLPAGCIVTLKLDKAAVDAQRAGTVLKVNATSSDTNQALQLSISLKGLAPALDRVQEIASQDVAKPRR